MILYSFLREVEALSILILIDLLIQPIVVPPNINTLYIVAKRYLQVLIREDVHFIYFLLSNNCISDGSFPDADQFHCAVRSLQEDFQFALQRLVFNRNDINSANPFAL